MQEQCIGVITTALTIILIVAKILGFVNIEWWQCAIPMLVGIALVLGLLAIGIILIFIAGMWEAFNEYRSSRR